MQPGIRVVAPNSVQTLLDAIHNWRARALEGEGGEENSRGEP